MRNNFLYNAFFYIHFKKNEYKILRKSALISLYFVGKMGRKAQ